MRIAPAALPKLALEELISSLNPSLVFLLINYLHLLFLGFYHKKRV